jgi:hypothetical protein
LSNETIVPTANPYLAFFFYCRAFNKGKDTRGFLFCKPKMHEVIASALQNSLSGFKAFPVSESKQAFAFATYHNW